MAGDILASLCAGGGGGGGGDFLSLSLRNIAPWRVVSDFTDATIGRVRGGGKRAAAAGGASVKCCAACQACPTRGCQACRVHQVQCDAKLGHKVWRGKLDKQMLHPIGIP